MAVVGCPWVKWPRVITIPKTVSPGSISANIAAFPEPEMAAR